MHGGKTLGMGNMEEKCADDVIFNWVGEKTKLGMIEAACGCSHRNGLNVCFPKASNGSIISAAMANP